jgi:3-mercaptopropionate dioxygenase
MAAGLTRFRNFVVDVTKVVAGVTSEPVIVDRVRALMGGLVAHDDWLPDELAQPHPQYYRQYLLHCDPLERFSVVSFVWNGGRFTPVHDHTVWGVVGVLRGAELNQGYHWANGSLVPGELERREPGDVGAVGPDLGDVHKVSNAYCDRTSISIHVYGANIGAVKRHVFTGDLNATKDFVSGYSNLTLPNIWDRSAELRAR